MHVIISYIFCCVFFVCVDQFRGIIFSFHERCSLKAKVAKGLKYDTSHVQRFKLRSYVLVAVQMVDVNGNCCAHLYVV